MCAGNRQEVSRLGQQKPQTCSQLTQQEKDSTEHALWAPKSRSVRKPAEAFFGACTKWATSIGMNGKPPWTVVSSSLYTSMCATHCSSKFSEPSTYWKKIWNLRLSPQLPEIFYVAFTVCKACRPTDLTAHLKRRRALTINPKQVTLALTATALSKAPWFISSCIWKQ